MQCLFLKIKKKVKMPEIIPLWYKITQTVGYRNILWSCCGIFFRLLFLTGKDRLTGVICNNDEDRSCNSSVFLTSCTFVLNVLCFLVAGVY